MQKKYAMVFALVLIVCSSALLAQSNIADSLTVSFKTDSVINYNVVVQAFPTNGGSITVDGTTYNTFPSTLSIADGSVLNVSATANAGFQFVNWHVVFSAATPNDNANPMTCTITQSDTIYAFFLPLPPDTFNLTVNASPTIGGTVNVNGNIISTYPTVLRVIDGTQQNVSALPNANYAFVNWNLNHHVLNPNNNTNNASFTVTQDDTLTANFVFVPDSFNLTVIANLPAGGSVNVNGNIISTYPTIIHQETGTLMNISALPTGGYSFLNWSIAHHTINPNNNSSTASFTLTQTDTLFVNFKNDTAGLDVIIQAFPSNGGNITVNSILYPQPNYPYTVNVPTGTLLNVLATPAPGFYFVNWHVVFASALPTDTANPMNCTINQTDTIYAFFLPIPPPDSFNIVVQAIPANGGDVSINGVAYPSPNYPYTLRVETQTPLVVTETPSATYHFVKWELRHHVPLPNDTAHPMNFTAVQNDTLYAYYEQDSLTIWVDVWAGGQHNPLAGSVSVGGIAPVSYPHVFKFAEGINLDFEAVGNVLTTSTHTYNYVFDHYDFIHHTPSPDSATAIVFITTQQTDSVVVYFRDEPIAMDTTLHLIFPSGFTPDNNGVNDVFRAVSNEILPDFNFKIYNRWGQLVFESHNVDYGWNGDFNNKKCDLGVYAYTVIAKRQNGEEVQRRGTITLVR